MNGEGVMETVMTMTIVKDPSGRRYVAEDDLVRWLLVCGYPELATTVAQAREHDSQKEGRNDPQ